MPPMNLSPAAKNTCVQFQVRWFHVGARRHRAVVDQSYQVALNLVFADKQAQDDYQVHPMHIEFVEGVFKKVCQRVIVYDFA